MGIKELEKKIREKEVKYSKARKVRSLLQKQKGLIKSKQSLTNFEEPVLFLSRRNGITDIFEKATAGRFLFEHSNGRQRFIDLRPSDQQTFPYGDKRVRSYFAHEDRPFAGWDDPVVDSESVMLGYEKTKATDLKYQERIERLKNAGKLTWLWILLGIGGFIVIVAFAYNTWIQPSLIAKATAERAQIGAPPLAGIIVPFLRKSLNKLKCNKKE